jgi:polysaccharide biosynthesis transport protein
MTESLPREDSTSLEPLHLRDYWHVLVRRRALFLLVLGLFLAAGGAWMALVRPVYRATAQILIERDVPNILDFDRNARATETALEDYYQTQFRLLQSRLLARRVVEKLNLTADPDFMGPSAVAEPAPAIPTPAPEEVKAAAASPAVEQAIDRFLDGLRVQPIKNSQMVAISFESHQPELTAKAANTLVDVYIQQTLEFRYRVSAEAGAWLLNETREQSRKVEAAEQALEAFKENAGLVSFEERQAIVEQKLKDLGSSLTAAKTRRLEREALYEQMRGVSNPEELPDAIKSPLIQSLRTELASLDRQSAQLEAKGYLAEHPEVVRLKRQVEGTRQKIALEAARLVRAARNEFDVAGAQEGGVAAALESAKAEALELSRRSLKYEALKRDLEASKRLSDSLIARQKQTDVARDVKASNIHVIDPAMTPLSPVRPQPVRDLALALLLGLGCGLGAAFFRDYLDTSLGRPSDVRQLGLPLLGVIPESNQRRMLLMLGNGHAKEPFSEGYRILRTALAPPRQDGQGQIVLVTSTLAGEGKSLTSVNLALTLASSGERVLLVDADLRRPVLHSLLKLRRTPGLTEVLAGQNQPAQAIVKVPGSRLSLLPSGSPLQRNPADLLATRGFRDFLDALRSRYDRVILDTPPAGAIADALIVAPEADGVLLVARSGKVDRNAFVHLLERLANARAHVLGVVLNRARTGRDGYDYGPSFPPAAFTGSRYALPATASARGRDVQGGLS